MRRRAAVFSGGGTMLIVGLLVLSAAVPPAQGWWWSSDSNNKTPDSQDYVPDSTADSDTDSLASAPDQQAWIPNGYAVGMEYNYKFDSQLASSLTEGEQFAVTRMSADVKLQVVSEQGEQDSKEKTVVVQCERVRVALTHADIDQHKAQQRLFQMDDMDKSSVAPKIQQTLQLAFEAKLSSVTGRVKSLRFQQDDQPWSENIKRSMVNMLQVVGAKNSTAAMDRLYQQPQQQQQQEGEQDSNTDSQPQQQQKSKKAPTSYKQSEKTIEGDCEVAYSVIPDQRQQGKGRKGRGHSSRQQQQQSSGEQSNYPEQEDQNDQDGQEQEQQEGEKAAKKGTTTVTKAINFQKCRMRPELRYNYLRHSEDYTSSNALETGMSPYEKEAVEVSSVYNFQVGKPNPQQISGSPPDSGDDSGDEKKTGCVVLEAQAVSQLTANILDSDRPAMATFALVKMRLESVVSWQKSNEQWSPPSPLKQGVSIVHSTESDRLHERFITEGDESYLKPETNPYPATENLPAIAVNVMKEMMKAAKVGGKAKFLDLREEAPRHLEHFIGIIRLCTPVQLKDVRKKLGPLVKYTDEQSWKNSKFLRDIFSDALSMACTQPSIAEFAELIKTKQVTNSKAARAIRHLGNCRVVSQKQLDQVMGICESEQAKDYAPLRHSCLLTWGTMAGAMCTSNAVNSTNVWEWEKRQEVVGQDIPIHPIGGHSDSDKWASELDGDKSVDKGGRICSSSRRRELSDKLKAIYDNAPSAGQNVTAEKIVAIKALGNMGLTASLPTLEAIAQNRQEEPIVRVQAIDAMRHISRNAPHAVQHALLPLFKDQSEPEEIRLGAFYQLMHAMPDEKVTDDVCIQMKTETNKHIQAFVQSTIREMAQSRKHFDHKTARVLKNALTKLKTTGAYDESAEIQSASQLTQYSFFSGDYTTTSSRRHQGAQPTEFGAGIVNTAVYGKDSALLPKELSFAVDSLFDGRLTGDMAQVTFQQQNGDVALQRLAQAIDAKQFDQVITRTRRSSNGQRNGGDSGQGTTSTYNPYELLKRFLSKHRPWGNRSAGSNSGDASLEKNKPKLLVSARSFGQDVEFALVDEKYVQRFFRSGKLDISVMESSKNSTDQQHHHYSASLGPEYKVKVPSIAGVPVVVSKAYPSLYACEGSAEMKFEPTGSTQLRGLRFTTNMQAQWASSVVNSMEVFTPIFTAGANTRHSHAQKLPLNFVAKLGKETAQSPVPSLDLELHLPKKGEDVALKQISSRPTTFTRTWPVSGRYDNDKYIERSERTLYLSAIESDVQEASHKITCPLTGLVMEARGHFPRRDPTCANANAHWVVGGENTMEFRILGTKSPLAAGKLRFRIALQQTPTDKEVSGKQQLLSLFDNRRELFIDSQDQEKQLVKKYVETYQSRMNAQTKVQIRVDAEQSPQQRSALFELTTFCDKNYHTCTATSKAEWKRGQADVDDSALTDSASQSSLAAMQQPYHITFRSNAQLAWPNLRGVYVGGIHSEHVLAHADVQITGTSFPQPGKAAVSAYFRPSAMKVTEWQMLLDDARLAGISDPENSYRQSRMPNVLRVNDFAAVWEFQSPVASKDLMRQGYYRMKLLPQSRMHIDPSLEDQMWDDDSQAQVDQPRGRGEVKIYTRVVLDEVSVAGKPAWLLNLTISDDPYALVKARGLKKLGDGKKPKGNHIRMSMNRKHDYNQIDNEDDYDEGMGGDGYSFSATQHSTAMRKQQRAGGVRSGQTKRASFFDMFSSNPADPSSYAECRMDDGRYVKSFDGQSYVIPLVRDCYTVMAKDCSPAKEFEVLAKKVQHQQEERIHVQFNMYHQRQQQKKFELFLGAQPSQHQHPSGRSQQRLPQMVIKLNGEVLEQQQFEENGIRVIDPNDGRSTSTGEKKLPLIYIIRCPSTGSEVEFNGIRLRIRLNKRFVNKQCGVCGHYNLDKADELMMVAGGEGVPGQQQRSGWRPHKRLASNLREFHASYIDKANQQQGVCDAEAVANRIKQGSQGSQQGRQQRGQQQGSSENSFEDDSYSFRRSQQLSQDQQGRKGSRYGNFGIPSDSSYSGEEQQGGKKRKVELSSREDNWAPSNDDFFGAEEDDEVHGYGPQQQQSSESSSEEQQGRQRQQTRKIKPKMATKVIEQPSSVCFSYRPVPQCPANTMPSTSGPKQPHQERINFVCQPRSSPKAREWVRELRRQQQASSTGLGKVEVAEEVGALNEATGINGQSVAIKKVWVPRECVPAY